MRTPVLAAHGLSRSFANKLVLKDASLQLFAGSVTGLIGANGQGKTTLLMILAGFLTPDSGTLSGSIVETKRLGKMLLVDRPAFYPHLSVRETLLMAAQLSDRTIASVAVDHALAAVGLQNHKEKKCSTLSMGMKQRLAWGHAILLKPALLLLDEPSSFLDPPAVMQLRSTIADLAAAGTSILMSSHNMHEIQACCHTIYALKDGRMTLLAKEESDSVAALEDKFA